MAILREMNARPVPDRLEQAIYIGGTEAPKEEYARFEKIAIDASRKLVEALKKAPDVPVGRVLVAQDPLERLAYAMVGPLESGVELGELSARDFTAPARDRAAIFGGRGPGRAGRALGRQGAGEARHAGGAHRFDGPAGADRHHQRPAARPRPSS